jgi:hypothetical protein
MRVICMHSDNSQLKQEISALCDINLNITRTITHLAKILMKPYLLRKGYDLFLSEPNPSYARVYPGD